MEPTAVIRELDVLLIDDSHDDVLLIERALHQGGVPCAVRHVQDAESFDRAVAERAPDVILADYHMPRFDGLAALRRARKACPGAAVLVVTATLDDQAAAGLLFEGADDYILKDRLARLPAAVMRAAGAAEERRRTEERLLLAAMVVEKSASVLFRLAPRKGWPIEYVSSNVAMWGHDADLLMAERAPFESLVHPHDAARLHSVVADLRGRMYLEFRVLTADGAVRWVGAEGTAVRDAAGAITCFQGIATDITERRRTDEQRLEALRRAQAQMESIGRLSLSQALAEGDLKALAREITEEATAVCGVARANVWLFDTAETELRCIDLYEAGTRRHTAGARLHEDQFESEFRALKAARYVDASDALTDPRTAGYVEGYLKPAGITAMIDAVVQVAGAHLGLLCLEHVGGPRHWEPDEIAYACQIADKIGLALSNRERRESERALRESERRLKDAQRVARFGSWAFDLDSGAIEWSGEMARILEWDLATPATIADMEAKFTPESWAAMLAALARASTEGGWYELDLEVVRAGGARGWITARGEAVRDAAGRIVRVHGSSIDITARKQAERELRFKNAILATQQETSLDAILVVGDDHRIVSFNRRFLEMWGIPEEVIRTGSNDLALQFVLPKLEDPEEFLRRIAHLCENERETLADELRLRDGRSIDRFSAPMIDEEGLQRGRVIYFRDITERKRSEQALRRATSGTVEAIAAMMESRDPYTAGHERRVADLAASIGHEMGLDEFTIEGLRFGALIHDIGKIQVPSELLVKPARLSEIEFELVKTHATVGYEIVKNIDFPWPVSKMVLQHHERIDGSGYPHGVRGEEIALEARILGVADVVEAMASDRPYRPGLGIEAALSEIESKRGTAFDAAAVDACLRLFREGRYTLPGT